MSKATCTEESVLDNEQESQEGVESKQETLRAMQKEIEGFMVMIKCTKLAVAKLAKMIALKKAIEKRATRDPEILQSCMHCQVKQLQEHSELPNQAEIIGSLFNTSEEESDNEQQ